MPGLTPPRRQALDILLTGGVLTKLDSAQQFRWRATGRRLSCFGTFSIRQRLQGGLDPYPRVVTGLDVRRRRRARLDAAEHGDAGGPNVQGPPPDPIVRVGPRAVPGFAPSRTKQGADWYRPSSWNQSQHPV